MPWLLHNLDRSFAFDGMFQAINNVRKICVPGAPSKMTRQERRYYGTSRQKNYNSIQVNDLPPGIPHALGVNVAAVSLKVLTVNLPI